VLYDKRLKHKEIETALTQHPAASSVTWLCEIRTCSLFSKLEVPQRDVCLCASHVVTPLCSPFFIETTFILCCIVAYSVYRNKSKTKNIQKNTVSVVKQCWQLRCLTWRILTTFLGVHDIKGAARGGAKGAQAPPLSNQNIDVYFLSYSPTL